MASNVCNARGVEHVKVRLEFNDSTAEKFAPPPAGVSPTDAQSVSFVGSGSANLHADKLTGTANFWYTFQIRPGLAPFVAAQETATISKMTLPNGKVIAPLQGQPAPTLTYSWRTTLKSAPNPKDPNDKNYSEFVNGQLVIEPLLSTGALKGVGGTGTLHGTFDGGATNNVNESKGWWDIDLCIPAAK